MKGCLPRANVNREPKNGNGKVREQYSGKVRTCAAAGIH